MERTYDKQNKKKEQGWKKVFYTLKYKTQNHKASRREVNTFANLAKDFLKMHYQGKKKT